MSDGFRLVMTKGPQPGQTFGLELGKETVGVGRDPSSDVVVNHPQVSRQHARFVHQGQVMVLEDLGSTNGTFVNGMRLTAPHTLRNGDVVGLGDSVTFTFYGPTLVAEDTVVARPGATLPRPDTVVAPPAAAPAPSYQAPPAPSYQPAPVPAPSYPPAPVYEEEPEKKPRRWLWFGCGCLLLLVAFTCVAVLALDYLQMLPPVFYEPLRWLGIF
jgi:predicted component of type VI protein secretion system